MGVIPPKPKDILLSKAAHLSKAAPNSWKEFVDALGVYARERVDGCIQAPSDKVLIAQGMARQINELLTLMVDASKQK